MITKRRRNNDVMSLSRGNEKRMEIYIETSLFLALNVKCVVWREPRMRLNVAAYASGNIWYAQESIKRTLYVFSTRYVNGTLAMGYIMIMMIAIFVVIVPRLYAETFKSDPFVQSLSH